MSRKRMTAINLPSGNHMTYQGNNIIPNKTGGSLRRNP